MLTNAMHCPLLAFHPNGRVRTPQIFAVSLMVFTYGFHIEIPIASPAFGLGLESKFHQNIFW